MKKISLFFVVMTLGLIVCNAQNKTNDIETVERKILGETFHIPISFTSSNERFVGAIGGPSHVRFRTDENYYMEIGSWGASTGKSREITIAGKSFDKQPYCLYNRGDGYVDTRYVGGGEYRITSKGRLINIDTGEIIDENPRPLTMYTFDLGNSFFWIMFEDKIPNQENLIKIFLGLDK